ncbi:MAG: alpha-L-rhamnosidase N-terminal domain-containing protein [Planctomycetota bacterium]
MSPSAFPTHRIWLDVPKAGPQTRLFRRSLDCAGGVAGGQLRVFAEQRYLLWINGQFVAAGPGAHHPTRAPFDHHDLNDRLQPGANVVAVLVHAEGAGTHQHVPSGEPGLALAVSWRDDAGKHVVESDAEWRVTDRTGWVWPTPKRGWALGSIEQFDAATAPRGWQSVGFDDSGWATPTVTPLGASVPGGITAVDRPTPPLRHRFIASQAVMGFEAVTSGVVPIDPDDGSGELGRRILELDYQPAREGPALQHAENVLTITGLSPTTGAAVHLDLGAFYVGQLVLEIESPGVGVIDVAWGETEADGRADCLRKGTSYVDRILAGPGRIDWRPIGFSGMRYLTLVFRGFAGGVVVDRVGLDATEPDLGWAGTFTCGDESLNAVWRVCERTIRVGTQDALMDCPTREQATYVGDGLPVAKWIARLTGDTRYWRDLVIEQFRRQAESGLIRGTPYSSLDGTLLDYVLIAVLGTRDYWRWTADRETVMEVLPAARRAMGWFDAHRDERGLLTWRWPDGPHERPAEHVYDPARPKVDSLNLFIDHPGLGWHNPDDAGIDRRGINAAIHAFWVLARRAVAELEEAVGEAERATHQQAEADALVETCAALFWDDTRGVYVDGVLRGEPLEQVSEQTNTLAVLAGWAEPSRRVDLLERVIGSDDTATARSGFYFWIYQMRAMSRAGMTAQVLDAIRRMWSPVLERGATTVWETPAGDHLDSWCHPWSCMPASFLLTDVLGLGGLEGDAEHPRRVQPRYDLLDEASGGMFTRDGWCSVGWHRDVDAVCLRGSLPEGVTAAVLATDGAEIARVSGDWNLRVP